MKTTKQVALELAMAILKRELGGPTENSTGAAGTSRRVTENSSISDREARA